MKKLICILLVLISAVGLSKKNNTEAISEPIALVSISPAYPKAAFDAKVEGWVDIQFTIDEKGEVKDPKIIDSFPPEVFDREALRAISHFKFMPNFVNKKRVPVMATKKIVFKLPEES